MASTELRAAAQQALEALEYAGQPKNWSLVGPAITALRAALAEPVQELGPWTLEQCDRVIRTLRYIEGIAARGEGRPMREDETLEQFILGYVQKLEAGQPAALAEPDSDSPERRCGGPGCDGTCCQPVQEPKPVAWRFEARHIDSAWAAAVTLKHPGPEGVYMRNVMPLYAHPPQRKPLTEEKIMQCFDEAVADYVDVSDAEMVDFARAIERAHGIGGEG